MSKKRVKLSENSVQEQEDHESNEDQSNLDHKSPQFQVSFEMQFWEKIWKLEQDLSSDLAKIDFKKDKNIAAVYNPLEYAVEVHKNFMRKYLKKAPRVLFLGMNPGLFGMCQTSASVNLHSFINSFFMVILPGSIRSRSLGTRLDENRRRSHKASKRDSSKTNRRIQL